MARRTESGRNRIQPSLLASLQEGVAGLGRPEPVATSNARATNPTRATRTTISVPTPVGEKARRLTLALTLHEQREATLGVALDRALDLLERELRAAGASIPVQPVELRDGPRSR